MTDFLIRVIPTPLPRPQMEEIIPGGKINPLDIPFPEMAEIDLSYPLVGLDWVLYPWTVTKGKTMELINQLQTGIGYSDNVRDLGFEVLMFLAGMGILFFAGVICYYVVKEVSLAVRRIWEIFRR